MPSNTLPGAPVRLGGNLFQLGNTFADLRGGLSAVADRMPIMTALPDGRYTISLRLPAGADMRYKYTLGDGFWNAEHKTNSEFDVRQLIVPQEDTVINEICRNLAGRQFLAYPVRSRCTSQHTCWRYYLHPVQSLRLDRTSPNVADWEQSLGVQTLQSA